jgi:hypothetical protein
MFDLWHWSGIQGAIRLFYKMEYGSEQAAQTLESFEIALSSNGMQESGKDYAINLAKRLRKMGCDKASAYMAAACAYASLAFQADTEVGYRATVLIQDSLENIELLHPAAARVVQKAKDEMLEVLTEQREQSNSPIRPNRISDAVMGGLMLFHSRLTNISPLEESSAATLGYLIGALSGVQSEIGGSMDDLTDALGAVFYTLFPEDTMAVMELGAEMKNRKEPDFMCGHKLGKAEFKEWLSGGGTPPTGLEELL